MDRNYLIDLCNRSFVKQEDWYDRDSSDAQRQVGELLALLKAGCDFEPRVENQTIFITVTFKGFGYFEDMGMEVETFYLPTEERLQNRSGDWY